MGNKRFKLNTFKMLRRNRVANGSFCHRSYVYCYFALNHYLFSLSLKGIKCKDITNKKQLKSDFNNKTLYISLCYTKQKGITTIGLEGCEYICKQIFRQLMLYMARVKSSVKAINVFNVNVPLICTSMKPGAMMELLQSTLTSAATRSSKKSFSGLQILPPRTHRSSRIILWLVRIRQFWNCISGEEGLGPFACILM